ncbi:MAG: hypothetical protein KAY50_06965 [Chitinophagaceae bacterium]|nr:hypothetical protein [Chitinophagaceae bacterium]
MGFLNKLFGNKKEVTPIAAEHAVIIHFTYGIQGLDLLNQLEEKLENVIATNKLGEYDGHEIAVDYSDGFLYMYGPNAEILFKGIQSTLNSFDFMKGASVKLRFGPPEDGVKELDVTI